MSLNFGSTWTPDILEIFIVVFYTETRLSSSWYPNSLSECCVWAQKSEKSMLHAKCMYGTLVGVTPSFHHHLSQNLLSSTFAPLWTYDENMEFSYNLWMEASRRGFVDVFVCVRPTNRSHLFLCLAWKQLITSQKGDKRNDIFIHECYLS